MRRAGILLHPSSLPTNGPCGDLGEEAYKFLDWLSEAGISLWQTLPLHRRKGRDGLRAWLHNRQRRYRPRLLQSRYSGRTVKKLLPSQCYGTMDCDR